MEIADTVAAAHEHSLTERRHHKHGHQAEAPADPFSILLDAYLALELDSDRHAERALVNLNRLIQEANQRRTAFLFGGLAGVGFVGEHLHKTLAAWVEPPEDDPLRELDEV